MLQLENQDRILKEQISIKLVNKVWHFAHSMNLMLNMDIIPKIINRQARQTKATKFHFFFNLVKFRTPAHGGGDTMTNLSYLRTVFIAESLQSKLMKWAERLFLLFLQRVVYGLVFKGGHSESRHHYSHRFTLIKGKQKARGGKGHTRRSGTTWPWDEQLPWPLLAIQRQPVQLRKWQGILVLAPHRQVVPSIPGKQGLPTC